MARDITLVDAGHGSLASVECALLQVGATVRISEDPDEVAKSRMVVLAGSGTYDRATRRIVGGSMGEALLMVIRRGDPFLGIALGMQMLFDRSQESEEREGFHILPGECVRFPDEIDDPKQAGGKQRIKIPHVGWNDVHPSGDHYYFVHSYYVKPKTESDVMWTTSYAGIEFPAAVKRDNVYGCQFQPEKSQTAGLRFLRGFLLGGKGG